MALCCGLRGSQTGSEGLFGGRDRPRRGQCRDRMVWAGPKPHPPAHFPTNRPNLGHPSAYVATLICPTIRLLWG